MERIKRYRGALFGLAVGDAVGTTLEFTTPDTFSPIDDMVGGGPFNLLPGEWTDDTSLALCLAESLIVKGGFDPADQMERYVRWWKEGHLSSNGRCFDIGITTKNALSDFLSTGEPFSGPKSESSAGNGSLMRLVPIPLFYANTPEQASEFSASSSLTTHGAPQAVDSCKYFAMLIIGALNGVGKDELLSVQFYQENKYWDLLHPAVEEVLHGSFKEKEPPDILGTGYVIKTLEAVLWSFFRTDNFRDGLLKVINLGQDADTTGAVYGQLAGTYYGEDDIPKGWIKKLALRDTIRGFAEELFKLS